MRELAAERPRFGYRRLHVLLRREGVCINHKKVYRLYCEEGLQVRRKKRKRVSSAPRQKPETPSVPNERWSMDFVSDSLMDGRSLRVLNVVDDQSRVCVAMEVDTSISGERVGRVLDRAGAQFGWPKTIVVDNGPEFTSKALDQWAYVRGIHLHFIQPGKPTQNCYVESLNGKFRDECLNENWFVSLDHARERIAAWRTDYNEVRPHRSLNQKTPKEYLRSQWKASEQLVGVQ